MLQRHFVAMGEKKVNMFLLYLKSHLDVHSLNDTGDDMEHLHFSVTLRHLLQQLE